MTGSPAEVRWGPQDGRWCRWVQGSAEEASCIGLVAGSEQNSPHTARYHQRLSPRKRVLRPQALVQPYMIPSSECLGQDKIILGGGESLTHLPDIQNLSLE